MFLFWRGSPTTCSRVGSKRLEAEVLAPRCVQRDGAVDLVVAVDGDAGLVRPGARHVARGVAATAEEDERYVVALAVLDAGAVALDLQIELAQAVAG